MKLKYIFVFGLMIAIILFSLWVYLGFPTFEQYISEDGRRCTRIYHNSPLITDFIDLTGIRCGEGNPVQTFVVGTATALIISAPILLLLALFWPIKENLYE